MNKQEAIESIKKISDDLLEVKFVSLESVIDIVSQIHEPQKAVLPKIAAEWIEKCKSTNRSLRDAMENRNLSAELRSWFLKTGQDMFTYPNQDIFARAWLDGFEIEQEKLYTVELFNGQPLVEVNNILYFSSDLAASNAHVSKDKLEAAGFGWVFDCSGVKVVEVE